MYRRGARFLWVDQGHGPTSMTREQMRGVLDAQAAWLGAQSASAGIAPAHADVYYRQIPPPTLAKMDGQLDMASHRKHTIHTSAAHWKKEPIASLRPASPFEWAHQAVHSNPETEVCYRIGPWIVRQGGRDEEHYFGVIGSATGRNTVGGAWFDTATGREVVPADYRGLLDHSIETLGDLARGQSLNRLVRSMLVGAGNDNRIPASLAVIVGALAIAEVRRRPVTHLTNLLCMDLVDRGTVSWEELLQKQAHPVARGGGTSGDPGEISNAEIDVAMAWLDGRIETTGAEFAAAEYPAAEAAGGEATALVGALFQQRMSSFASDAENQGQAHQIKT